jgi:hypothetical protein
MGPDHGAVQQKVFQVRIIGKGLLHPLPDALLTPAEKAFIHGVPSAILLRERPPLGTGPGYPQDPRKETAAVLLFPHIHTRTGAQKLNNAKPLIGVQLFCKHTSSLKVILTIVQNVNTP